MLKTTIILLFSITFFLSSCDSINISSQDDSSFYSGYDVSDEALCGYAKGQWYQFRSSCTNDCRTVRAFVKDKKILQCASVMTYGCKCPKNHCWDHLQKDCIKI